MNTNETRTRRPFPYLEVLKTLVETRSYEQTAKKHGYYAEGEKDPIKPLRAHLHRARHVGFNYNGKTVKYPPMDREGNFKFRGRQSNALRAILDDKSAPVEKTAVTEPENEELEVKFREPSTRGANPKRAVVVMVDKDTKMVTLRVPQVTNLIPAEKFLAVLERIKSAVEQTPVQSVVAEPADTEHETQPEKTQDVLEKEMPAESILMDEVA